MKSLLLSLYEYRELILNLTINELKLRYRNSILGFLWQILNPIFYLLILAIVFSKIIRFHIENYTIFLFAGLTSWLMIQQTVTIATASVVNNQNLIRKVYLPKIVFPLSNVLARYVDHLILTLILFGFLIIFKAPFTINLLLIPFIILLHFLFSLGLSLIFATAYIKIKDVQHIIAIAFQALFYVTPIIYSIEILPPNYRPLFLLNPLYYFVECFRFPIYNSSLPPQNILFVVFILTFFALFIGLFIFLRNEKYFVFHLS
ncbi:ABC transporter permease [Candidatus Aminicenantes bacterium AH-873-B07]|nr:ABC transporter permease [Candidatus Aminicenantes bacterium AH-873-B07]